MSLASEYPAGLYERIRFRGNPAANPDSVVTGGNARFTVLTPRLLRMEWSETGRFEDRGTYAFPTRYTAPAPEFTHGMAGDMLEIDTGALHVHYFPRAGRFSPDSLSIEFQVAGRPRAWAPGKANPGNLRGTRRTLDGCAGDAGLEEGLLSRDGWALFDDSVSVVFNLDDGWVAPRPEQAAQDWYFFGYDHDYQAALRDYTRFGGCVPLIPRYVLGAWWSRYWAYSERDLKELVRAFEAHDLPLDVLVLDMDWHTPHSWTGYTWNRELFPDPEDFLRWLHRRGLRATLNLHPAEGVQAFEDMYPRFAEALGLDPSRGERIPFRCSDKAFVRGYFELLHHTMEDQGVDFWWLDWQQGEACELPGLDPLPWLNHLHHRDSARRGARPMLYSRWGGLGNHRYPIGFSGDTHPTWAALQFQPYFTATAGNVLFGWWSHDIGGHEGPTEPELYARWVQFGALSPCLRLHATKHELAERRPWAYPEPVFRAAQAAFHRRYRLVPYLYTMACAAGEAGLSLCRPMYYAHPEAEAAYAARYQYYLGDQAIAAPIVFPADPGTGIAATDVWVPGGTWIDYETRESFTGPRWVRLVGGLERAPMLVKAGAILPLAPLAPTTDRIPADRLILEVFPPGTPPPAPPLKGEGSRTPPPAPPLKGEGSPAPSPSQGEGRGGGSSFRLYADDGLTLAYRQGEQEWTEIRTRREGGEMWWVEVDPVEGRCAALPGARSYEIRLVGSRRPDRVTLDGAETAGWSYDPEALTTSVHVPARDKRRGLALAVSAAGGISALGEAHNRRAALADVRRLLGDRCPADPGDVDAVLRLGDAPGVADAVARLGGPLVRFVEFSTPEEAAQQLGRVILGGPAPGEPPCALRLAVRRYIGSEVEAHVIHTSEVGGTSEVGSQIIDLPFAFDGRVRTQYWEAEAAVTWRGATLTFRHRSRPLFPAIYAWRVLVYDEAEGAPAPEQVLRPDGALDETLAWRRSVQAAGEAAGLYDPHELSLFRHHRAALRAGARLGAYLAATLISPDERDAALDFRAAGEPDFYLNGERIRAATERVGDEERHPRQRGLRRSQAMRLRAGRNTLLVHSRPTPVKGYWSFSGALVTPAGEPMPDVTFE